MFLTVMTVAEALTALAATRRSAVVAGGSGARRRAGRGRPLPRAVAGLGARNRRRLRRPSVRHVRRQRDLAGAARGHRLRDDGPRSGRRGRPGHGAGDPDRRAGPERSGRRRDGRAHERPDAGPCRDPAARRPWRRRPAGRRGGRARRHPRAGGPAASRCRSRAARLGRRHRARRPRPAPRGHHLDR